MLTTGPGALGPDSGGQPGRGVCILYESGAQWRRALAEVIVDGLGLGDGVVVTTSGAGLERVPLLLTEAGLDPVALERDQSLTRVDLQELGLERSQADGSKLSAFLRQKRSNVSGRLRLVVKPEPVDVPSPGRVPGAAEGSALTAWEAALLRGCLEADVEWFVLYDRRRAEASRLLRALRLHAEVWIGPARVPNPLALPPAAFLGEDTARAELGTRLAHLERHQELREALRVGEARYRELFESLISGFALHEMIYDDGGRPVDYRFLEVNPAFERLTGLEAARIVGKTVREVIPGLEASWVQRYGEVVETGLPARFLDRAESLGRTFEVVAYRPSPGHFAVIFNDITAQIRAEEAARRALEKTYEAQRLESLGLMAGAVAHDFNNMLVGILGNASLALADLPPGAPAMECLQDIELAARRAAEFVKQLLAYSGRGRFVVEPVSLPRLVEEMGHLLQATIPKGVTLRYQFDREGAVVSGDASQLRQVVMNLIVNAAEAIGDGHGVITVSIGIMACDREYLEATFSAGDLAEGRYVALEISDTGRGMTQETRTRLFEPFFSTKNHGRGLGLAAVQGIVRGHGGAIRVYSEPDQGTTFKILLPETSDTTGADAPVSAPALGRASGVVLVVDDEEAVRVVARRALHRAGFDVLSAADGEEALAIYRANRDQIVLVLLDMMMPRMGGAETFSALRRLDPGVCVILTSGYNEQDAVNRFAGRGLAGFIQKPYPAQDLVALACKVLADREEKKARGGGGDPPPETN